MGNRFLFDGKDGILSGTKIVVDTETGVQYLYAFFANTGGLTLLVDRDGKPLLDERYAKKTEK